MKKLIGAGLLLIVLAVALAGWQWQVYRRALDRPLDIDTPVVLEVSKGESLKSVARRLKQRGILENDRWLLLWAFERQAAGDIKVGEYSIPPGTTPKTLLSLLVSGKVRQHRITLVEGWTVKQVLEVLRVDGSLEHTLGEVSLDNLLEALGLPAGHPEGRFFPDTYFFIRGTDEREILRRAYRRMEQVLAEEWQSRMPDLPLQTPDEALILASIVEKETGRREEQPRIAGVFIRRLQQGMLLQSDPTVIYGMGDDYQGNIRRHDLLTATPYNTYVQPGLPPTPIALPGRAAIHAVLHPAPGQELYFVAKGDGSHAFSATLKEHNRAVAQYQLKHR